MQTRQAKETLVAELVEKIKSSKAVVYANYKGVTVKDLTGMRKELAKSGSSWQVMKKTLLNIALKEAGVEGNVRELPGQIGVAFSADEVAAAKTLADFVKANKGTMFSIEGGALGEKMLSVDEVKALAEQTAKATGEISQQIAGIQTATQESVGAIKEISSTIERLSEISSTIAAAVEEQGAAEERVGEALGRHAEPGEVARLIRAEIERNA